MPWTTKTLAYHNRFSQFFNHFKYIIECRIQW